MHIKSMQYWKIKQWNVHPCQMMFSHLWDQLVRIWGHLCADLRAFVYSSARQKFGAKSHVTVFRNCRNFFCTWRIFFYTWRLFCFCTWRIFFCNWRNMFVCVKHSVFGLVTCPAGIPAPPHRMLALFLKSWHILWRKKSVQFQEIWGPFILS